MSERKIEVVISAKDDYTAALKKFNAAMGEAGRHVETTNRRQQDSWMNTTIRIAAVTMAVRKLYRYAEYAATASDEAAAAMDRYNRAVEIGKNVLGKIFITISSYISGVILFAASGFAELLKNIVNFVSKLTYIGGYLPGVGGKFKEWTAGLDNTKFALDGVSSEFMDMSMKALETGTAISKTIGKSAEEVDRLRESTKKAKEGLGEKLKVPEGGGSLMAFVLGDLDAPLFGQKVELAGINLGKRFSSGFNTAISENINPLGAAKGDLKFKMSYITRVNKPDENRESETAALYEKQNELEDMMLNNHLQRLNSRYQAERDYFAKRHNITNESFSALNGVEEMAEYKAQARLRIRESAYQAMQDQMLSLVETGKFSVGAMAQVVAQQVKVELTGLAARAAIWAIYETAMGFRDLASLSPATAALHFASAGQFASISVAALAATAAVHALFGGTAQRGTPGSPTGEPIITTPAAPVAPVEQRPALNVTVNAFALSPASVDWDELTEKHITPALERLSGDRDVSLNIRVTKR